ncbi:tetratricopeptide repeat protein [Anabaena sp. UHCC 0204]|uniref:tetratricopeptide repeat protein n=1 Tax=Anabaena sp. UHCC 0204 TaxID=2590009 RepID=UPI001446583C|nr:tetratricopeptide repeat protein [Anabaena sp. UHCC 0204]
MFRWLLQWLNKFLKYPFGSLGINDPRFSQGELVVDKPPELTNADLELLFNELLEGVHQARGQQWALKYLQRMEPRITIDRWIDWLLIFGDKLLASPAPNHQLAKRMVQLGELGLGEVSNLAYDIGIQLLRRNLNQEYERKQEPLELDIFIPTEEELDSPGQELLRQFGEQLWEYQEADSVTNPPTPQVIEEVLTDYSLDLSDEFLIKDVENENLHDVYVQSETEQLSYEYTIQEFSENVEEVVAVSLTEENLHHSLANVEPQLASTLDELVVRLEQSTNLVQQLASDLAIRDSQTSQIVVANQAEILFYEGLQQAKSGNLLAALALYEQASQIESGAYEYWFNQGLTLYYLQRFPEAIAAYDQTLALKPDFYKVWYSRGCILGELGDFDGAIASFDQAIAIKADYEEAWSSRGLALLKLGLIWEAISSYDQALNLQPQDPETWYYRGIALAVGEQYPEAIASYDQALNLQPDYHEVWIDRGVVLFNLKQWLEAIESWDQALSVQPEFYLAWYNRGVSFENLGRREDAIASYQQAIAIKPDFHPAWYNQAVALFYLERFAQAISCYDNALQIKLDYWEAWLGRGAAAGNLNPHQSSLIVVSSISAANPALNLGGYPGKLASYQEGLKHLRPDTHPEGWGRLHIALGNTYYEQGKKESNPRDYWHHAISEYQLALSTLTPEDFPELHLEILQSLTKMLICLGETATAQELQKWGMELLQQLLTHPTRSDENKKQLALKFAGLGQLAVDLSVNTGDLVEAWEIAEQGKNSCLHWLMSEANYHINNVNYTSIQQLLNPSTAIIYWHFSPAALHTFIIKDQAPSPILLLTPIQDIEAIPEAVRRLIEFENWLADWQQLAIPSKVLELQNILNIPIIIQELEGIDTIILIPHRDLYKLPLHSLFNLSFSAISSLNSVDYNISYLPSVAIGISLQSQSFSSWHQNNGSKTYPQLKFDQLASEIVSETFAISKDFLSY